MREPWPGVFSHRGISAALRSELESVPFIDDKGAGFGLVGGVLGG